MFLLAPPILSIYTVLVFIIGKPLTSRVAGILIPKEMSRINNMTTALRKELLKNMKGNVLDLGAGGGAYIEYINRDTVETYVALEPNRHLHNKIRNKWNEHFEEKSTNSPKLKISSDFLETYVHSGNGKKDASGYFDYIILGNVMCEVPNQNEIFLLLDQLLKPGTGRVYFSEHVLADPMKHPWLHLLQHVINPVWSRISDGCNCNRETLNVMKSACPHWEVIHWTFTISMLPWNIGLAMPKNKKE